MSQNRTLIVYETKRGITEKSANKIADVLREQFHLEVDVVNLAEQNTPDLAPYRNVVVGGGVRMGKVYSKATDFLGNDLAGKQVAFFICSAWGGTPGTNEYHDQAKKSFAEKALKKHPNVKPVSVEVFGGFIRYFNRTMINNIDFSKVEAWAAELGKIFTQ
jgi:menaquinone-dependent protoporphyrinogen IX oxidase